jgi:glutamate synthase (NADPH/NADH) small chain
MSHKDVAQQQAEAKELLEKLGPLEKTLKLKERLEIPAQMSPCLDPIQRGTNLEEVALNLSEEQARIEAMRCLDCKKKPCVDGCPVGIDIPRFIKHIASGDFQKSIQVIKETSLLPAICGRVCPQEKQCQLNCTVGKALKDVELSVGIGRLERFVADWERTHGTVTPPAIKPDTGKRVAVIGSGPAGLVVAADVRREGHDVTLFEAFHKMGGVMRYGIPEFRLPNEIVDKEIDGLRRMGVKFETNYVVGRTRKLKDLMEKDGFDAVFVATGAGLPKFMGIPGEDLVGVFASNEYLTRANLMRAYEPTKAATPFFPSKKVAVLGGGNVAMDTARMALRLGAEEVNIIYRRTKEELPARREEVVHAEEEGIHFRFLENVVKIIGDENSRVTAVECVKYELGEPDASGRRRPVEIPNSNFTREIDTVLVAIGNGSNPLLRQTTPDLVCDLNGQIIVDEKAKTHIDKVYAGGDIVLGAATVILAMGEGRKAAKSINELLAQPGI